MKDSQYQDRRDFIKITGKADLAAGLSLTMHSFFAKILPGIFFTSGWGNMLTILNIKTAALIILMLVERGKLGFYQ